MAFYFDIGPALYFAKYGVEDLTEIEKKEKHKTPYENLGKEFVNNYDIEKWVQCNHRDLTQVWTCSEH